MVGATTEETIIATDGGVTLRGSRDPPQPLERGASIGRYVVLARLGAGGMGVVYAVYDPDLDRKLAVKLLHGSPSDADATQGRVYMLREAQAMAKVSHPNVVTVHDVGEHGARVYLAMEFVEGRTLTQWIRERRPTWKEVLPLFIAAGEGLGAAHDRGLVHRDFKPDNVMVGDDGRVRVMDFGLARSTEREPADARDPLTVSSPGVLDSNLTQRGAIVGTPAYMAPEQHLGGEVGPLADQFAFCIALWEAVYGERPFEGETLGQLALNVTEGSTKPPPAGVDVPSWLRQTLQRGLMPMPEERHPAMPGLLVELRRGTKRARSRRRFTAVAAVGVLAAAPFAYQAYDNGATRRACSREGREIDEVWNAERKEAVRTSVLDTSLSFASTTAESLLPALDRYAAQWQEARTDACLDARLHGQWESDTLERAQWCLDERRLDLAALVDQLVEGRPEVVRNALVLVFRLQRMSECRDPDQLARRPARPEGSQAEVDHIRALLARAGVLSDAGNYSSAQIEAEGALEAAEALEWAPLVAESKRVLAGLWWRAGRYEESQSLLEDAFFEALHCGAKVVAAEAAAQLIFVVGVERGRQDDGMRWARHADAILSEVADPGGLLEAKVGSPRALLLSAMGKYEEAITVQEQVLGALADALGPDHPEVYGVLSSLARGYLKVGRYDEAQTLVERSVEQLEATYGPEHPTVANALNILGIIHGARDLNTEALRLYRRARDIREAVLGPDHPQVGISLANIGVALQDLGQYDEARKVLERAVAVSEAAHGPDHPQLGKILINFGVLHLRLEKPAQARPILERALAIQQRSLGKNHRSVAATLTNLGIAYYLEDEIDTAEDYYRRALDIYDASGGPGSPKALTIVANLATIHASNGEYDRARLAYQRVLEGWERSLGVDAPSLHHPLIGLARTSLELDRPAEAVRYTKRAVKLLGSGDVPLDRLAEAKFILARASWEVGEDREEARSQAREAIELYRKVGALEDDAREEAEVWLEAAVKAAD